MCALVAGIVVFNPGAALAAADYCGLDGTYTDTATDPDSVLRTTDIQLGGISANDCFGVQLDHQASYTGLWSGGWTGTAKSDSGQPTFTLGGATFGVSAVHLSTSDDWDLHLTGGAPPDSITVDLLVVLKAASGYVAYFFNDRTFAVPSSTDGHYTISFYNNGGRLPGLSHMELSARLQTPPPPPPVPEPASLALLGTGLAGLAGAARRRMRQPRG